MRPLTRDMDWPRRARLTGSAASRAPAATGSWWRASPPPSCMTRRSRRPTGAAVALWASAGGRALVLIRLDNLAALFLPISSAKRMVPACREH